MEPLNPRNAFFGGRTCNNIKIHDCKDNERIRYIDVCGLDLYINKRGKYVLGHPKIFVAEKECEQFVGNEKNVSRINGLIMCNVLPPRNLCDVLPPRTRSAPRKNASETFVSPVPKVQQGTCPRQLYSRKPQRSRIA